MNQTPLSPTETSELLRRVVTYHLLERDGAVFPWRINEMAERIGLTESQRAALHKLLEPT